MGGKSGGGKKGGSTPVPNFAQAATAQSISSRPNWSGPTGSQSWQIDPKTGQATMQFNSPFQGAFNNLAQQTQNASNFDPTQARNQAISSNYNQAVSRLDPQWGQNDINLKSQMANLGGTDNPMAGQQAQGSFDRAKNDAYQSAMNNAIQLGNQTQQVGIQQAALPFQQLGQLTNAAYQTPYMGQGAQYLSAANDQYGANRAQQAQNAGSKGSMLGGLGGIGGSIIGGPVGGMLGGGLGSMFGGGKGSGDTSTVGNTPAMFGPGF